MPTLLFFSRLALLTYKAMKPGHCTDQVTWEKSRTSLCNAVFHGELWFAFHSLLFLVTLSHFTWKLTRSYSVKKEPLLTDCCHCYSVESKLLSRFLLGDLPIPVPPLLLPPTPFLIPTYWPTSLLGVGWGGDCTCAHTLISAVEPPENISFILVTLRNAS